MSRQSIFVIVVVAALGVLGLVLLILFAGQPGFGVRPGAQLEEFKAEVSILVDDLSRRLVEVEEKLTRLSSRPSSPGFNEDAGIAGGTQVGRAAEAIGESASLESRLKALELRIKAQEEDPVRRAYTYLSSKSEELRREGIEMLKDFARYDPMVREAIRDMLEDPGVKVREEALQALAESKDRESIPHMMELFADSVPRIREKAVGAIGEVLRGQRPPDPDVEAVTIPLMECLSDAHPDVREEAADALGDLRIRKAIPALIESLEDSEYEVQERAIGSLRELRDSSAIPQLRALYDREPGGLALPLATALKDLGDKEPLQHEITRLSQIAKASEHDEMRCEAIRSLAEHAGEEAGRDFFKQFLNDSSPRVRKEAEEALQDLEGTTTGLGR